MNSRADKDKFVGSIDFSDGELTKPQGLVLMNSIFDPLTSGGLIGPRSLDRAPQHGRGFFCFRRGSVEEQKGSSACSVESN